MNYLEIIAVIFGLISVYLSVKPHIGVWPTGIVSDLAYCLVFFQLKLYANSLLQLFLAFTCVVGWYFWLYGGEKHQQLTITRLTSRQSLLLGIGLGISIVATSYYLHHHTDAAVPYWDSSVLCLSVIGQILLMRKKFETWWLWLLADAIAVVIYCMKGIYLTAGLYSVYCILNYRGLCSWRRSLHDKEIESLRIDEAHI